MNPILRSRLHVIIYVMLAISLNYGLGQWIWSAPSSPIITFIRQNYSLVSMWIPGVIALIMSLLCRDSIIPIRLGRESWRSWLEAYIAPLLIASVIGFMTLALGLTVWRDIQIMPNLWADIHDWFVIGGTVTDSATAFIPRLIIGGTLGLIPFLIHALGEEIGWRGYLLPKLEQTGWRYPILIQGVIWSQWHLPFLLRTPLQSDFEFIQWVIQFTIGITLLGMWIGYLYQQTRNIWIVTLAHASHNLFLTIWGISVANGELLAQDSWFVIIGYGVIILLNRYRHRRNAKMIILESKSPPYRGKGGGLGGL